MKPAEPQIVLETVSKILEETGTVPEPSNVKMAPPEDLGLLTDVLQDAVETKGILARFAAIIKLNLTLATKTDPHDLLQAFIRGAREIVISGFGCVGILAPETQLLKEFCVDGIDSMTAKRLGKPVPESGSISSIVQHRIPVRLSHSAHKLTPVGFSGDRFPTNSFLGVPLLHRNRIIGFLCFADKIGDPEFSHEDERLAVTLAAQLSVCYENTILHSNLQKQQTVAPIRNTDDQITDFVSTGKDITDREKSDRVYRAQHSVTRALAESSGLADAAPKILKLLCETSRSEFASLWISDSKSKTLRCVDTWKTDSSRYAALEVATRVKQKQIMEGLLGEVWQASEPLWIADIRSSPEFRGATEAQAAGIRSVCAFPAITKTAVAIIELFSPEVRARDQGLVEMFSSLGVQISQFIDRKQSEEAKLELERQLLQSQKMEAIGQLAGGVAHDFNNLLMAMTTHLELLGMQVPEHHPAFKITTELRKITDQGSKLTRQLLAFSRHQVLSPEVLDLNQTIANIREMLCVLLGENIQLTTNFDTDPATIQADPGQVEQLLVNISVNARDAMPLGGTLTIQTENVEVEMQDGLFDVEPGPYVRMRITDTGSGMDPETLTRIFEPFFTTKEKGKGTGLGLSTVYGIVKQNGGRISVDSSLGTGTTFQIYFPRVDNTAIVQNLNAHEPQNLAGKGETILLVDDHDAIRNAMGDVLRLNGYQVFQASSGLEAINIAMNQPDEIDVLISDMIMPEMGGQDVSMRLRQIYPGIKTLYMSGFSQEAIKDKRHFESDTIFVSKPVSMQTVLKIIREMLERRSN